MKEERRGGPPAADKTLPPHVIKPGSPSFPRRLRTYFLTGIVVTGPIGITIYLVWVTVAFIDAKVTPLIPTRYNPESYLPFDIPGLGVVVALVGLTLVGFVSVHLLGRTVLHLGDRIVKRMPVVRSIYGTLKQIFETVLAQSSTSFREVVLFEYPRKGTWVLGFVTGATRGEIQSLTEGEMVNVFVPTTPNPTSGFLLFVPRRDLVTLAMSVEDGIKLVISGGLVSPEASVEPLRPDLAATHRVDGREGVGG
ncbi:MAG: DUF502 domain-containing protein [Alphaproteobacteria bacterium]|nr:DUF502 domain-containing protein [Alphaproteobacteria bacterium]